MTDSELASALSQGDLLEPCDEELSQIQERRLRGDTQRSPRAASCRTIDKATMREFEESCLTAPSVIAPEEIKRIREGAHVSQPVFARYLNTSESTVQKWEAGTKRPSGMALKLLAVVEKHGIKVLT